MTVKKYRKAGLGKPHRLRALCSHREDKKQAVCWLGGTAVLELAAAGSAARAVPFDLTNTGSRPPDNLSDPQPLARRTETAAMGRRSRAPNRWRSLWPDTPAEAARVFSNASMGVLQVFLTRFNGEYDGDCWIEAKNTFVSAISQ